jgi:hypothetical protein
MSGAKPSFAGCAGKRPMLLKGRCCSIKDVPAFIELHDRLLREGISHTQALQSFEWPAIPHFNRAHDYDFL